MSRVVVIGAGAAGLAVSARLAATGHDVTLLERAPVVGGKLGVAHLGGRTFDTGPSLLTLPHVYQELFDDVGLPAAARPRLARLDPACRYRFADGTWLDLPGERAAVPSALDTALGPGAGAQWDALLRRGEAMWRVTEGPFLSSAPSARDLLRLSRRIGDVRTIAPWRTLRGLGRRYLTDPRLRAMLDRYATYAGSDPRRAPAAFATIPFVEQEFGSWHVVGGLRRLADALLAAAVHAGARVRCDAEVTRVLVAGGRVAGVRLADGEELAADVVVSAVDAAVLHGRLLADPPPSRPGPSSLSGLVLLLGLRGRDPGAAHHTVLFAEDYDAEFDAVLGARRRPVPAPTVYVCAPADDALRPPDGESWFVLVNAPPHGAGVDWDEPGLADRYAERLLDLMAARGLDVRHRIARLDVRTPADLERDTGSPGGAIYGAASHGARAAFRRPANRSALPGLYLAGGSAHPGGGLPLVAMSARIVARLVGPA
ncbi:MAG TPA: phytoene desaturase family protein [Pseudonocardiaceae bacterium]